MSSPELLPAIALPFRRHHKTSYNYERFLLPLLCFSRNHLVNCAVMMPMSTGIGQPKTTSTTTSQFFCRLQQLQTSIRWTFGTRIPLAVTASTNVIGMSLWSKQVGSDAVIAMVALVRELPISSSLKIEDANDI